MRGHRKVVSTNFSAGELDPKLIVRSDIQAWQQGARILANMRPLLHGGVTTRPGSDFINTLAGRGILIPFEFSETQGYVMAFREFAIDIFFDDGTFAHTITGTPWNMAMINDSPRYAQSGDTMILCHRDAPIMQLKRTGAASFVLTAYQFTLHGPTFVVRQPYHRYAGPGITLTPSAVTGAITVTASAPVFVAGHNSGRFRIAGKQIQITGITSSTVASAQVLEVLSATTATEDWDEQAFSPVHGYPHAVCFHNERLVFGGARDRPSGIWASQVGDFFNFDLEDGTDDKAIWVGIGADKVVEVLHLSSFRNLSVFTDQVELYQPESESQPWSPKTTAFRQQTGFGCQANIRPTRFDEAILFVQKYGHQVREFLFNPTSESYSSDAVSVMNPSRMKAPISIAAVTSSKDIDEQYAFLVMADGSLAMLHSLRAQRVTAWSVWFTQGAYADACAVNGKVFLVVLRQINGVPVYCLERVNYGHALDCARVETVAVGGTTAPASHVEGRFAQAVNNGYAYEPDLVTGGVYTIFEDAWAAPTARIGLPFGTLIETLPVEIPTEEGSSRGRNVRIVKAGIEVYESVRMLVDGRQGVNITNVNDDYSVPPDAQSGMYDFVLLGFGQSKTITVQCDVPVPITVLSVALEVVA